MEKKVDKLAKSRQSVANKLYEHRKKMPKANMAPSAPSNPPLKAIPGKPKAPPVSYAPREGKKKKHYGKPFGKPMF